MTPTTRLNLRLPRSWSECSTEELETIARVIAECAERSNVYKPFDMFDVKVALFFALSKLTILEPINPRINVEEQYYVCKHPDIKESFNLYLWQINYWVYGVDDPKELERVARETEKGNGKNRVRPAKKKVRGLLDWLDDTQSDLVLFPYEQMKRCKRGRIPFFCGVTFQGPAPYMDGFSWQQYRFAQDYMVYYVDQNNRLLKLRQRQKVVPAEEIAKQEKIVDSARSMFLATIFNRKARYIDAVTGKTVKDFTYTSNQHSDNAEYFRNFPEVKWQVILFWWTGMMYFLQKQYPHCFKKSEVKGKAASPLELYTRTTATMEKYLGLDEDKVNRQLFHLVFQHMEDMAKENEEIERMRRKH